MKRILIFFAFALCACGGSAPKAVVNTAAVVLKLPFEGELQAEFDTIKLGRVNLGETVIGNFVVNNISDTPIVIVNIVPSCGCASVDYDPKPIMGGESRDIKFEFHSEGRSGLQVKAIDLVMSDYSVGKIFISAEVIEK